MACRCHAPFHLTIKGSVVVCCKRGAPHQLPDAPPLDIGIDALAFERCAGLLFEREHGIEAGMAFQHGLPNKVIGPCDPERLWPRGEQVVIGHEGFGQLRFPQRVDAILGGLLSIVIPRCMQRYMQVTDLVGQIHGKAQNGCFVLPVKCVNQPAVGAQGVPWPNAVSLQAVF